MSEHLVGQNGKQSLSKRPSRLPNLLFIGADKCGSTWFAHVLSQHPDVWVTPAKDLYYFVGKSYGDLDSYARNFRGVGEERWVAEVCHDYLTSDLAPERIYQDLGPDIRLVVCIREPIDRALSQYLFAMRNGVIRPGVEFDDAIVDHPLLIANSRYGKALKMYTDIFGFDALHVVHFDELQRSAEVARRLWHFLGVADNEDIDLNVGRNQASKARNQMLANQVKRLAVATRGIGGAWLVGQIKSNAMVARALYRPIAGKPEVSNWARGHIQNNLAADVDLAESLLDVDLRGRWGW